MPANFGWIYDPEKVAAAMADVPKRNRLFGTAAPALHGAWDRKTSISLWELHRKLTGRFLPAQRQVRGTCGPRASSLVCNLIQAAQIVQRGGAASDWKPVAHAPIYGGARQLGNMLSADPRKDGVIGAYCARWMRLKGLSHLAEVRDRYDSDQLAVYFGAYGVPPQIAALGADNLVLEATLMEGFDQIADLIASGGGVIVCSQQGFSTTRDSDGFCTPYGRWDHAMGLGAVVNIRGRLGIGCGQSWGPMNPTGPLLAGCPDYVFGIDARVIDHMCKWRDTHGVYGIQGWAKAEIALAA